MDARWFKGHKDKEARKKELKSYKRAYEELTKLLEDSFEETTPDYDCPSWAHKQADVNGANRKLRQILKLIDIKE